MDSAVLLFFIGLLANPVQNHQQTTDILKEADEFDSSHVFEEISSVFMGLETFQYFRGTRFPTCDDYIQKCAKYHVCMHEDDCDDMLIQISKLDVIEPIAALRNVEGKTNPCVAMYVFCLPTTYNKVVAALGLKHHNRY